MVKSGGFRASLAHLAVFLHHFQGSLAHSETRLEPEFEHDTIPVWPNGRATYGQSEEHHGIRTAKNA
jgi:hypothetical protein